jgi:hypothetical protein
VADVFFASNLLILGVLFLVNWAYASKNHRLVDPDLDEEIITLWFRRGLVMPIVSVLVIVFSFFIPNWSLWLYLVVPFLLMIGPFRGS